MRLDIPVHLSAFFIVVGLLSLVGIPAFGQIASDASEKVDNLKLQLIDLKTKEEEAKIRVAQLDEALKPENIERSLAGVGSTRPEDLREQRRLQLTNEKTKVTAQLATFTAERSRLESAISNAETQAYQESARGSAPIGNGLLGPSQSSVRWLVIGSLVGVVVIVAFVGLLFRRVAVRNTKV